MANYGFINGKLGEEQAIWEADTATQKVRYMNKNAKNFSWTQTTDNVSALRWLW
jgi:hypothetical protein